MLPVADWNLEVAIFSNAVTHPFPFPLHGSTLYRVVCGQLRRPLYCHRSSPFSPSTPQLMACSTANKKWTLGGFQGGVKGSQGGQWGVSQGGPRGDLERRYRDAAVWRKSNSPSKPKGIEIFHPCSTIRRPIIRIILIICNIWAYFCV